MAFTDFGTHGMLDTPSGSVLLRPEQYATFGITPPPVVDEPPPPPGIDPAAGLAPPLVAPAFAPDPSMPDPSSRVSRPGDGFDVPAGANAVSPPSAPQIDAVSSAAPIEPTGTVNSAPPESHGAPVAPPAPTDLSSATYGNVYDEQRAAVDQGTQAGAALIDAETRNNNAQAQALDERNAAVAAKQAEFAQREADDQKRIDDTSRLFEAKVKEFAEKKVDRANYGVSPMQAIGVALSGIGSAYKGQGDKNPALDLLLSQIDKYVDDQYRAKESLGQEAGLIKGQLGVFQEAASNTQARKQLAVAGLLQKSVLDMEAMAPRMQNETAKARVLGLAAAGREKIAGLFGGAVQLQHGEDQQRLAREQQERESRRSAATAAANRRENARQFDLSLADSISAREQSKAAAVAAATTEADRDLAKREVADLKMSTPGPDGKPIESTYRAKNEKTGDEIIKQKAAVDAIVASTNEIMRIRQAHGDMWKAKQSEDWQRMTAAVANVAGAYKELNQLGAYDNGVQNLVKQALGGDPMRDGFLDSVAGSLWKGDASAGIKAMQDNAVTRFDSAARAGRDPRGGDYVPYVRDPVNIGSPAIRTRIDETTDAIRTGRTPEQIRDDSRKGWSTRLPGNRADVAETAALNASDPTGNLSKAQAAKFDDLARQATTGKTAAGSASDPAQALVALEALALEIDKNPATANRAIETLARIGTPQSDAALARVEAGLAGQAKSERDREVATLPVRLARNVEAERRAVNDPSKSERPTVAVLLDQATRGDKEATALLADVAMGRPYGKFGKPSAEQVMDAQRAINTLRKARR